MRLTFPQSNIDLKADADKSLTVQGFVLVDASSGSVKVTLPAVTEEPGTVIIVKRSDGSPNALTLVPSDGTTIDGAATLDLATPYAGAALFSDGAQWLVLFKI